MHIADVKGGGVHCQCAGRGCTLPMSSDGGCTFAMRIEGGVCTIATHRE